MLVMTIIALSGVLVAQRVTADSSGASTTQADGSSTQIAALTRYVDAGDGHTCVVLNDASLKCFGSSSSGQIGSGGTASLGDAQLGDVVVLAVWYGVNIDLAKQLGVPLPAAVASHAAYDEVLRAAKAANEDVDYSAVGRFWKQK